MKYRGENNPIWNYFSKCSIPYRALCNKCGSFLNYKTTTGNLITHLKIKHTELYEQVKIDQDLVNQGLIAAREKNYHDEDSNSSIKFSSEIWENFEQENDMARCTICQKMTENTVEEMKLHLEEAHPSVLIRIFKPKGNRDSDTWSSDGEKAQEEDTFTEVVYLDEPTPRKRATFSALPPKRRKSVKPEQESPRIEYTIVNEEPKPNAEIDSFVNYLSVLLKNVPKEMFPKLQLDIISLVLNAQMTAIPPNQDIATQKPGNGTHVLNQSIDTSGDYHITIETEKTE